MPHTAAALTRYPRSLDQTLATLYDQAVDVPMHKDGPAVSIAYLRHDERNTVMAFDVSYSLRKPDHLFNTMYIVYRDVFQLAGHIENYLSRYDLPLTSALVDEYYDAPYACADESETDTDRECMFEIEFLAT